jgi:hypothetical protein
VTQGAFPCVQVEARLVGLHRAVDAMAAHQARIAARLAAAVANGNTARAHRLERQAAHLTTVQGRFAARVAGLDAAYAENCTPDPGPDA